MEQTTDLLQLIEEKSARMSKGHRAISRFILQEYDKAAFMTALKIGERVGVSESTVVRFAMSAKGAAGAGAQQADDLAAYGNDFGSELFHGAPWCHEGRYQ